MICIINKLCYLEPVNTRPPSFSSDATTFGVRSHENSSLALLCNAQAYPVAVFR